MAQVLLRSAQRAFQTDGLVTASRAWQARTMCTASQQTQLREAAKMTFPVPDEEQTLKQRPVPTSAADYEAERRKYRKEVASLRKMYKAQWEVRKEVEAAEAREQQRRIMVRKAENQRLREVRKRKIAARHVQTRKRENALAQERRNYKLAARTAYLEAVAADRREWLMKLDSDSKNWITEDKIDDMISEETFEMTHPWFLEEWYERRQRRRQLQAARQRGETFDSSATIAEQPNFVATVSAAKDELIRNATGTLEDGRPALNALELMQGDESMYVDDPPEHVRTDVSTSMFPGAWESDDDMLDGFGSDWEEDVPKMNWFGKAEAMARTGIQPQELYAEESMLDIKARLDAFEAAHDAKFPLPNASPEQWARMAEDMQKGHFSQAKHVLEKEAELVKPFEEEAAKRKAVLDAIDEKEQD